MRPVDNFELIRGLLDFSRPGTFYFLQILKRRKDNPDLGKDMIHIADYYIDSFERFDEYRERVINLCEIENARAYFRLNRRDAKQAANETLRRLTEYVISENYKPAKSAYASCVGEFHSDPDKTWIVDIDWKDIAEGMTKEIYIDSVVQSVESLVRSGGREPNTIKIPTKNGLHLITRPFRLDEFRKHWSGIEIHKDNPSLLYCK
jgi:hypothetical protein